MKLRQLGKTGIYLSEIGYGCASLWGKDFFDEQRAIEIFDTACVNGINFFDTGSSYGLAEERLGKCLRNVGYKKRKDLVIATKCGTKVDDNNKYVHDWSPQWMQESVNRSIEKLGLDYIDMLHLHGPHVEDIKPDVVDFLQGLKEKGLVKAVGINSFETEVLEYVCKTECVDFVMLDYNIMRQDREELIQRLNGKGIGVIAGAALAQSLYSNRVFKIKNINDVWYFLRAIKNFREHILYGKQFRFINNIEGITGNQVAMRFVLDNPYITSAVFGTTNSAHMIENIKACDIELPDSIRCRIIEAGKKNHKVLAMDRKGVKSR